MKNQSKLIKFLLDCKQACESGVFNGAILCRKHRIGKQLPAVMKNLNVIKGKGRRSQWIYPGEISYYLAKKIRSAVQEYNNQSHTKQPITASLFAVPSMESSKITESEAIKFLKSRGYKILKPNGYTEI